MYFLGLVSPNLTRCIYGVPLEDVPVDNVVCSFFPGYLHLVCKLLKENLEKMPGDLRTLIGFITFDSTVHFYSLKVSSLYDCLFTVY